MTASEHLRVVADEYWEARLEASPLYASFLGDHRYDDRADDVSVEAEQRLRSRWTEFRDQASGIDADDLDETDRVTRDLLAEELDDSIRSIDRRMIELASDQMQGVHAELLVIAEQLRAPEPEHARMAVARIPQLARLLDQAAERYVAGARAGRTPAQINVARSLRQIAGYLDSPLAEDPFVKITGPDGWDDADSWRAEMSDAVREVLRPAFERYRDMYTTELRPVARPDERPGLCHIPDGDELYQILIEHHTGLPLTARELHDIGVDETTNRLPAEFADIGIRALGTADLGQIFDKLKNDPDLRYADGAAIVAHAQRCLDSAVAAMGDWFGILPQAPCVLTPVPDYLEADVPAAYYMPPAPDGSRPGTYFVNLHQPTERGRFSTAAIAFHEAIPGHHLQLAIATERTDLPSFRRLTTGHNAFVEGWALYTERVADEMGLYESPLDRLGLVASDGWRACRLVVDTGLHAMGWSRPQAIDFMVEHMPVDLDSITVEVDRYIGMPGQALSYKVGQREILQLRADAAETMGERFEIKDFHDVVLGAATVSLPVLRRRVEDWVQAR